MKVTTVNAVVTEKDILNIINEYVKVDGLNIISVNIGELIRVQGTYKKGVDASFYVDLGIGNIHGNTVNIKIFDVKVFKVPVPALVKSIVIKKILQEFKDCGISSEKDVLSIDLALISKYVPFVNFELKSIKITNGALKIEIDNLSYDPEKDALSFSKTQNLEPVTISKIQDGYSKVRREINHKIPDKYEKLLEYAMIIPDIAALLWRLMRDKRVEIKMKLLIGGVISYLVFPIDIMPDFIPFFGKIDDIAVAFFGLQKIMSDVPKEVILQNWQGKADIFDKVNEVVNYIYKIAGSGNIAKVISYIKKISEKGKVKTQENEECNHIH